MCEVVESAERVEIIREHAQRVRIFQMYIYLSLYGVDHIIIIYEQHMYTNVFEKKKKDEIDMSVNENDVRILIRTGKSTSRIINKHQ